jgi:stress response protein SCP2
LELSKRPGEMARRLDHLLRLASAEFETNLVINRFSKVADQISTPVLLQVKNHFEHRNDNSDVRIIFPKGNVSKVQALKNELPKIDQKICSAISLICGEALMKKFASLEDIGNVYIDPILKNYNIPFNQRSASSSLNTMVRGSKIDLPEGDTIRFFTWWKNLKGFEYNHKYSDHVDLDLSAVMFTDGWEYKSHISYTNLREKFACYSGDITSAPNGAAEYIDVDMSKAPGDVRYIVMNVLSYSCQPMNVVPEACCGWMVRQHPNSGEIFEPKTVNQKIAMTVDTKICIPAVIDIKERQIIWCDIALTKNPNWCNNIESNLSGIGLMGKSLTEMKKANIYDLLHLHGISRGKIVDNKDEADVIYDDQFAYQTDKIIGEYLV